MQHRRGATSSTFLAVLAALWVAVVPAHLEAQAQPRAPEIIEDEELRAFAQVYLRMTEVRTGLEQDLQQNSGQAEAQQLQQQAQSEMRGIMDDSPLTVERYTRIGRILNTDPEQRARFRTVVEELRDGGGGESSTLR